VLVALLGFPIIQSFLLSFQSVRAANGLFGGTWTGLANYQKLLDDPAVVRATTNTVYFTAVEVVAVVVISLLFAQLLNNPRVKSAFFTVVLLIPWAIAPVANATIWKWIYNGNYGILNQVLLTTGIIDKPVVWLADPSMALNLMLLADIWKSIPFITLLLLAGLRGIPPVLFKAAKIDGASRWQTFWSVTLPQIRPVLLICVVLQSIWAVKVFDLIYVLTKGGPADGTVTLNFLAYRSAFNFGDLGYGSALANLLFIIMFVAALVYVRILGAQRRRPQPADQEASQ
jgi:multiple sugar transport system permease protein